MERSRCASETLPSVTASRIGSSATAAARMTSSVVATANHGSRRYSGAGGAAGSGSSLARESLRERCRGEGATDSGVEWTSRRYGPRRSRNVTFSRDASATSGRGKLITHSDRSSDTRMANRLSTETSPYLLQHANNPVDWRPWGEEALSEARREDKPILLSVGYAACHWCHVMEHESFEDDATAVLMNENFINIKVDREERPDIDGIYMQAVQAMTGHGGWPVTMFLLPGGRPFYGGTYFPPDDRDSIPSFRKTLEAESDAYAQRPEDGAQSAQQLR